MIDLHIHTTASDGEFSPTEIVNKAIDMGLTHIAITDHDTVNGLDEAISYGKDKNITIIPGVELNAKVGLGQMHILGYYIDYTNKEFLDMMKVFENDRNERNTLFIKKFKEIGIDITMEEVKKYAIGSVVGKPHFARVLMEKGYINSVQEGFDKYFDVEPLKNIKRRSFGPEKIIKLIKNTGGIAVLAHPQSLKLDENSLKERIIELKSYGLDGLECYHSKQTCEEMKLFNKIAKDNNLLITLGSDYHRDVVISNIEIGHGKNDNLINSNPNIDYIISNLENAHKIYVQNI